MKCRGTQVFDWMLQLAALVAVLFVLNAGVARGALPSDMERHVIAETFRAGISPSLALAVAAVEPDPARWTTRNGIVAAIAALRDSVTRYPNRLDRALANYDGSTDGRRYATAVRGWMRRFDADARAAAQALAALFAVKRPALDDFDDRIGSRARHAGRRLDDFPFARQKG